MARLPYLAFSLGVLKTVISIRITPSAAHAKTAPDFQNLLDITKFLPYTVLILLEQLFIV